MSLLLPAALLSFPALPPPQTAGDRGRQDRTGATVVAVEAGHVHDLWSVSHRTWSTELVATGVTFQPLALVGYAYKDSLRSDRPRPGEVTSESPGHVLLPREGALYRVRRAGREEILRVKRGEVSVLFSTTVDLHPELHVSPDGRAALVASTSATGGDVWRLDLAGKAQPRLLTAGLPPLVVEAGTLRAGSNVSWFVADGDLYQAIGTAQAKPLDLGALEKEEPDGEPLLAEGGAHLLIALEQAATQRRLVLVDSSGAIVLLTPTPGAWSRAGLQDPLGPFIALAPDGSAAAWRAEDDEQELYVAVAPGAGYEHLTREPDFPAYIDNVGVLGFLTPSVLLYLAGDEYLNPVEEDDVIGAADMYSAEILPDGSLLSSNLTRSSGQTWPPFTAVGQLVVEHLKVDPSGQRAVFDGPTVEEYGVLACFRLGDSLYGHGPNLQVLIPEFDDDLSVAGANRHLTAFAGPPEGEEDEEDSGPRAHVLQPFMPGDQMFTQIAEFPEDTELRSVAATGRFAAFVEREDEDGSEIPWRVDLLTPVATPLLASGVELSSSLALTERGDLIVGIELQGQPQGFVRIAAPGQVTPLDLPVAGGFPLAD